MISVNDETIEDIFDYRFLIQDTYLEVLIQKADGEEWVLEIDKDDNEDLGMEFENGLMDEYKSCRNKCIFCFIDQMPKGMRKTLYFKDDDSRLSFLQGNYVTLTNMSDNDINRIIRYRLSPINISFQTTDPQLRCMMTGNRFAGEALKKVDMLFEAGIIMNGQIVLCKGINDGANLEKSFKDLMNYAPTLESVSIVPVGLTKYREGLFELESFNEDDANAVIDLIERYQAEAMRKFGIHLFHASDEFYLLAKKEIPTAETYDGYLQLENGVGMLRLLQDEFDEANDMLEREMKCADPNAEPKRHKISIATGYLAFDFIKKEAQVIEKYFPGMEIDVYPIRNDFFGEKITVAGLVTGGDLIGQLKGKNLGEKLLIPECMLRADEPVFLDDIKVSDVENALQVKVDIVKSNGQSLVKKMMGE